MNPTPAKLGPAGIGRAASEAAAARLRMPREIAGDGLMLTPISEAAHWPGFSAFFADPASKFSGGSGDAAHAWRRMAMWAGQWRLFGFGIYAIQDDQDRFCGYVGPWFPPDKTEIELVYGLVPDARGAGIGRRAVSMVRAVADACGAASLVSYIAPDNTPSQKLAAAVGAVRDGDTVLTGGYVHGVWRHPVEGRRRPADEPVMLESTVMPLTIATRRLALVQWRPDHFEVYAAHEADPHAQRFVGGPSDRPTAWRALVVKAGQWALRGTGMYAVERDGELVGHVGFYHVGGWPERELAWHTYGSHGGTGYAKEAAAAVRAVAAEQGITRLVSHIDPDNAASIGVARALGAWHDGEAMLPFGPLERYVHPIAAGGVVEVAA